MTQIKSSITIGLIGFGNVGQGVQSIIDTNKTTIEKRLGQPVRIKTICVRNTEKYTSLVTHNATLTTCADDILTDPDIDIVVEVIGGETPAYDYIKRALENKKYVVTANKELIAKHKKIFFDLAQKNNVDIFFEASVGGGIPIIKSFKVGYSANEIESVYGILNGTTNFILTKLFEDQQDFETVLNEAKALGFAEADPTADISGLDAAYKIVILTAVALKRDIQLEDIHYEGIDEIQLQDVQYLDELNYRVRLIAKAKQTPKGLFVAVYPTAIPTDHPLAMVRNEFNAIYSTGNMVGESMIYGKGAGSLPTGSAVMSDILDIAFDAHTHQSRRNLELNLATQTVLPITENHTSFYLRVSVNNKAGVLEALTAQFKTANISIQQMIQKTPVGDTTDIVLITEPTNESIFNTLTASLIASNAVIHIPAIIRVGL
jgi:homoserine dehydrogenase